MRTKNLNLKKKIAFIASVAMIATTATYLPAGTFTASAATIIDTAYDDTAATSDATAATASIQTFAALVKINGKYLGWKGTEYKLFSTLASMKSDGYTAADVSGLACWTDASASDKYDDLTYNNAAAKSVLAIPYVEVANPTVSLEFKARKGAQLDPASATEIEVTLDEYGKGVIADKTTPVIGFSDDSDWKSKTTASGASKGSYEKVDYSGLRVVMNAKNINKAESIQKTTVGGSDVAVIEVDGKTTASGNLTMANVADYGDQASAETKFSIKKKEIKPDSYPVVVEGGVNANVLTATLKTGESVDPGDVLKIKTAFLSGWTISGAGYNSTDKTITVQMGDNGYAESGLVTATKGTQKEYFKYVINNFAADNELAEAGDVAIAGVTSGGFDLDDAAAYQGNFKIEHKPVAMNVGGTKKFVDVYTVYNNEAEDDATADTDITITTTNQDFYKVSAGSTSKAKTMTIEKSDAGCAETEVLQYDNATKGKYFKIIFTNEYEVEYKTWNSTKKDFETESTKIKTVKVKGRTVSKPEDIDLSVVGKEYVSWNTTDDGTLAGNTNATKIVFSASNGDDQIEKGADEINPNMALTVVDKVLLFNVKLDANGGKIVAGNGNTGAKTSYDKYNGDSVPVVSTFSNTNVNGSADWDGTATTDDCGLKYGYNFIGWNTDKNATKALTIKELEEAFPGEGKTLTLYAVYKAQNEKLITFNTMNFDAVTGSSAALDYKNITEAETTTGLDIAGNGAYTSTAANFATASDKVVNFVPGQKLGTLPTPVKKGYKFDGWYVRRVDPAKGTVTGVKVTADTIADESIFDTRVNATTDSGKITVAEDNVTVTLYARFIQETYDIEFETGNGSWNVVDYAKDTMPVSFKFVNDGINVTLANGKEVASANAAPSEPTIGSNQFDKFDGWFINGSTTKVKTASFWSYIKNLDKVTDIKAVAAYKDQTAQIANISIDSNGGAFYIIDDYNNKDKKIESYLLDDGNGPTNDEVPITEAKLSLQADNPESTVVHMFKVGNDGNIIKVNTGAAIADGAAYGSAGLTPENHGAGGAAGTFVEYGWTVARPGYTFTGWYSDKECTKPYTFGNFPKKGVEDVVYAGWKVSTSTKWQLVFDVQTADGEVITWNEDLGLVKATTGINGTVTGDYGNPHSLQFVKTYNGTTGETVNAADKSITVGGKKYVFSAKRSADMKTSDEVEAKYLVDDARTGDGLNNGQLIVDNAKYTVIEGIYVEEGAEPEVTELGKATDVKVAADGTVTFKAADNAVKYQVCKIVNGTKYYSAKVDATSIKITPAKQDYSVYVIAFDENGKSTHSETVKVTVKSSLGVVKNPKVTESMDGDNKIGTVTWDKVEGATWYKVFKIVNGKRYWGSKVTSNTYVFKNLPTTSSYIIYVAAGDDNGNVTYSARTKISKYPQVKNVKISADKKTVTFDKAQGAVEYQVAKLVNNTSYYSEKSDKNSITLKNAAKSGQQVYVLAFFKGEDGKTYSSYSDAITVE